MLNVPPLKIDDHVKMTKNKNTDPTSQIKIFTKFFSI